MMKLAHRLLLLLTAAAAAAATHDETQSQRNRPAPAGGAPPAPEPPQPPAAASSRAISWWWDSYHSGSVDGLVNFCTEHKNIVSRVMLSCEVFTCVAADWSNRSAPRGTCSNNNGTGGRTCTDSVN